MAPADTPPSDSLVKPIAFGAASAASAGVFGWQANAAFVSGDGATMLIAAMLGMLWLVMVVLQTFLVRKIGVAAGFVAVQLVAFLLSFLDRFSLSLGVGIGVFFAALLLGFFRGRAEMDNSLEIHFFKIGSRVIPPVFTGFSVLIALYTVNVLRTGGFTIPEKIFAPTIRSAEPIVRQFIPSFALTRPVGEFLEDLARTELPPGSRDADVAQAVLELREGLEKATGERIAFEGSVYDALYGITTAELRKIPEEYKTVALVILGIFMFFFIKGFSIFVGWIVLLIAFLFYQLLLAFNFLSIGVIPYNKEIIVLK